MSETTPFEQAGVLICGVALGGFVLLLVLVRLARGRPKPPRPRRQPEALRYAPDCFTPGNQTQAESAYFHQGRRWQAYCRIMSAREKTAPYLGDTSPTRVHPRTR